MIRQKDFIYKQWWKSNKIWGRKLKRKNTVKEIKSQKQPENCTIVSLTQIEPQLVFPVKRSVSFLFLEKMYKLSGFSLNQSEMNIKSEEIRRKLHAYKENFDKNQ